MMDQVEVEAPAKFEGKVLPQAHPAAGEVEVEEVADLDSMAREAQTVSSTTIFHKIGETNVSIIVSRTKRRATNGHSHKRALQLIRPGVRQTDHAEILMQLRQTQIFQLDRRKGKCQMLKEGRGRSKVPLLPPFQTTRA